MVTLLFMYLEKIINYYKYLTQPKDIYMLKIKHKIDPAQAYIYIYIYMLKIKHFQNVNIGS